MLYGVVVVQKFM